MNAKNRAYIFILFAAFFIAGWFVPAPFYWPLQAILAAFGALMFQLERIAEAIEARAKDRAAP